MKTPVVQKSSGHCIRLNVIKFYKGITERLVLRLQVHKVYGQMYELESNRGRRETHVSPS